MHTAPHDSHSLSHGWPHVPHLPHATHHLHDHPQPACAELVRAESTAIVLRTVPSTALLLPGEQLITMLCDKESDPEDMHALVDDAIAGGELAGTIACAAGMHLVVGVVTPSGGNSNSSQMVLFKLNVTDTKSAAAREAKTGAVVSSGTVFSFVNLSAVRRISCPSR